MKCKYHFSKSPLTLFPPFLREQNLTERGGEMKLPTFFTALDSCGGKNGITFPPLPTLPHECCANPAQMGYLEVTQPRALEVSQSKTVSLSNSFPLVSSLNSAKGTRNATQMGACLPQAPLHMQKETHVKSTSWWCERTSKQPHFSMCSVKSYGPISCSFLPFPAACTTKRFQCSR